MQKIRIFTIVICFMLVFMFLFWLPFLCGFAESPITSEINEMELYNLTNTFNVNSDCFDENGTFICTKDENYLDSIQYHLSYDMTVRNDNEVMDVAQI